MRNLGVVGSGVFLLGCSLLLVAADAAGGGTPRLVQPGSRSSWVWGAFPDPVLPPGPGEGRSVPLTFVPFVDWNTDDARFAQPTSARVTVDFSAEPLGGGAPRELGRTVVDLPLPSGPGLQLASDGRPRRVDLPIAPDALAQGTAYELVADLDYQVLFGPSRGQGSGFGATVSSNEARTRLARPAALDASQPELHVRVVHPSGSPLVRARPGDQTVHRVVLANNTDQPLFVDCTVRSTQIARAPQEVPGGDPGQVHGSACDPLGSHFPIAFADLLAPGTLLDASDPMSTVPPLLERGLVLGPFEVDVLSTAVRSFGGSPAGSASSVEYEFRHTIGLRFGELGGTTTAKSLHVVDRTQPSHAPGWRYADRQFAAPDDQVIGSPATYQSGDPPTHAAGNRFFDAIGGPGLDTTGERLNPLIGGFTDPQSFDEVWVEREPERLEFTSVAFTPPAIGGGFAVVGNEWCITGVDTLRPTAAAPLLIQVPTFSLLDPPDDGPVNLQAKLDADLGRLTIRDQDRGTQDRFDLSLEEVLGLLGGEPRDLQRFTDAGLGVLPESRRTFEFTPPPFAAPPPFLGAPSQPVHVTGAAADAGFARTLRELEPHPALSLTEARAASYAATLAADPLGQLLDVDVNADEAAVAPLPPEVFFIAFDAMPARDEQILTALAVAMRRIEEPVDPVLLEDAELSRALLHFSETAVQRSIDRLVARGSFDATRFVIENAPRKASPFDPTGLPVAVDVGGFVRTFVLDRRGRAKSADRQAAIRLRYRARTNTISATLKVRRADLRGVLADERIVDADIADATSEVVVRLLVGDALVRGVAPISIKAKAGKKARAKSPRRGR